MGHTRFAPIALRTNATFITLKSAKTSRAYGKKQRRTMNSVWRPKYKRGLYDRASAWVWKFSATARDARRQGDASAILSRQNLRLLQRAAGSRIPDTFWPPSFSIGLWSCRQKEIGRTGSRTRFRASSRKPTLGVLSERPPHRQRHSYAFVVPLLGLLVI